MPSSTKIVEMTPAQSRAARALLDCSQTQLAAKASLGLSTVVDFERERRVVSADAIAAIRAALESAGVEFTNGGQPGVRLRKTAAGLDADIKDAKGRSEAKIPAGPSPASGMGQLRRGLAKNELRTLKQKKDRTRSSKEP